LFFGSDIERRIMRQHCARISASMFGNYPFGEDYKLWLEDKEFFANLKRLSNSNHDHERKYFLRECVKFSPNQGSMAECGCYIGASTFFMAKERPEQPIYVFDSFEGLSTPGKKDAVQSRVDSDGRGTYWQKSDLTASEEKFRENTREFDNVVVHKGWIPECFGKVENDTFSFIHIDVDLYQPTLDSLKFFYPRVVSGGVILMDDYGFETCAGAYRAAQEFFADKPEKILHIPTGQGMVIVGHSQ